MAVRFAVGQCSLGAILVAQMVRRDGDIAGYRWGVDRKRELLRREAEPEDE